MRIAVAVVWSSVLVLAPLGARADFVLIASEATPGLIISNVDPSISEDGTVVFIGGAESERIYVGSPDNPSALSFIDLTGYGLTEATSAHTEAGFLVFIARRGDDFPPQRGVYALPLAGGPLSTLIEGCSGDACAPDDPRGPRPFFSRSLAISPNGTVAFSTVANGAGAIYRGPVDGSVSILQSGTAGGGFLFNTINLDVNDEGKVAVQTEYTFGMLQRGIFVLQTPGETAPEVESVLFNQGIGVQQEPSFADNSRVLYGEPDTIYRGVGVPYGDHPPDGAAVGAEVVADTAGGYATFARLNPFDEGFVTGAAAGNFALEAFLDDTRHGVFTGPDPALDAVLVDGDPVSDGIAREIYTGAVNSNAQIVLRVEVERAPDDVVRQILRFEPEVCPPPHPPKPKPRHKHSWRKRLSHHSAGWAGWASWAGWLYRLFGHR